MLNITHSLVTGKPDGNATVRSIGVFCGHERSVSAVAISICLDMVVTGSKDGTVNVHTVKDRNENRIFRMLSI